MDRPLLACLLPVRNGAPHLDGWLESVGRFADVVIALDDGSTDDTRARLHASPLVEQVLVNPVRPSYAGWDDARNRSRLLAAAATLDPRWIMFLDADERVAPDDAAALRDFVEHDADPDDAYLFRVYRMIDDLEHYDQTHPWVARLFAHRPGLRLPESRLHLVPVPESIPASRRRRTTIRIQHLAGITDDARRTRVDKYREADPDHTEQRSYAHLLVPPRSVRPWWPRSPHLAVLANEPVVPVAPAPPPSDATTPAFSAVVIAQDDEDRIEVAVRAVVAQEVPGPFEVIVVTSGRDRTAEIVRNRFPTVDVVELGRPVLPGAARNAGLRRARGEYVTFPGSHIELLPGALAARLRAHRRGHALVMPSTRNGTPTAAGWAAYFLDHSGDLPDRPSERLAGPPTRCSYPRDALLEIGGFPEDMRTGEDTVVNKELFERGYSAYHEQASVSVHHSPCRTTKDLVTRHFVRGKGMARILFDDARARGSIANRRVIRYVLLGSSTARLVRITANVGAYGNGLRLRYLRALPLVMLASASSWLGGCYELARLANGRRARADANHPDSRHT